MSFLLKKPIKMSSSSVNLVDHHLNEIRARSVRAAEGEESSSKPKGVLPSRPINRPSAAAFMSPHGHGGSTFGAPSRLYSAQVYRTGTGSILYPDGVFLIPIPVSGPTRKDAIAAVASYRLNLALNSGSQQEFCFLGTADDGDQNISELPDLNFSPADMSAPMTEFVRGIKSQNIFQFIDYVLSYLVKYGSTEEERGKYKKIMSGQTETQLGNLDSIRIWNILTLEDKLRKALVEKGVIEIAIHPDYLPPPQEQLVAPPLGYEDAANHVIDYKYKPPASCHDDNETLSDARNYDIPADGYHSNKTKRKAVVAAGDLHLSDHLQIKKTRYGGVLSIEEPIAPIHETEDSDSSD